MEAQAQQVRPIAQRPWQRFVRPPAPACVHGAPLQLEPLPWLTLQPAPGVLDEAVLEGLDYLLSLAASHGIKLVLTLAGGLWCLVVSGGAGAGHCPLPPQP